MKREEHATLSNDGVVRRNRALSHRSRRHTASATRAAPSPHVRLRHGAHSRTTRNAHRPHRRSALAVAGCGTGLSSRDFFDARAAAAAAADDDEDDDDDDPAAAMGDGGNGGGGGNGDGDDDDALVRPAMRSLKVVGFDLCDEVGPRRVRV